MVLAITSYSHLSAFPRRHSPPSQPPERFSASFAHQASRVSILLRSTPPHFHTQVIIQAPITTRFTPNQTSRVSFRSPKIGKNARAAWYHLQIRFSGTRN